MADTEQGSDERLSPEVLAQIMQASQALDAELDEEERAVADVDEADDEPDEPDELEADARPDAA